MSSSRIIEIHVLSVLFMDRWLASLNLTNVTSLTIIRFIDAWRVSKVFLWGIVSKTTWFSYFVIRLTMSSRWRSSRTKLLMLRSRARLLWRRLVIKINLTADRCCKGLNVDYLPALLWSVLNHWRLLLSWLLWRSIVDSCRWLLIWIVI